ncbi:MAG TPA: Chromate resistance protein ChrB [Acidimicrobiia bacterium]|nr:Chromate resistance protein ChrB [Acidimicrobiia bacterium]
MVTSENWVLMSYRMPREPSTPRIAVWRRLKGLGVAQLGDGLVGLPFDASTKESLEWVTNMVEEAAGSATMWIATPTLRRYGRELAAELRDQRAAEYQELIERTHELMTAGAPTRSLRALRAELRRIERRDYFPPPDRAAARDLIISADTTGRTTL